MFREKGNMVNSLVTWLISWVEEGSVLKCHYYKGNILYVYILISCVTGIQLSPLVNFTMSGCFCTLFTSPFLKIHTHGFNPYHLQLSIRNQINQWPPKHWEERKMKYESRGKTVLMLKWNTVYQNCCKSRFILVGTGFPSYSVLQAVKCYDKIKAETNGSVVPHKLWKLINRDGYHAWWAGLKRKIHILFNNLIFF